MSTDEPCELTALGGEFGESSWSTTETCFIQLIASNTKRNICNKKKGHCDGKTSKV